jgi:hypothetical protein
LAEAERLTLSAAPAWDARAKDAESPSKIVSLRMPNE